MASGDLTTTQIGSTIPLAYGPVRATGQKMIDYTAPDSTIYQAYGLAEGEWDGIDAFFVNGTIFGQYSAFNDGTPTESGFAVTALGRAELHFHPGTDTPIGSSVTVPASRGTDVGAAQGDQLLDYFWAQIPDIINRQAYSRLAYYFISFKPTSSGTSTASTALNCVGDFRTTKCRIFDANGNQTGYRYTLNPAWHFVDAWLRRVIKPEYGITINAAHTSVISALSSSERACFDWGSIVEAATYYDGLLLNGKPRFQGAYAFASSSTLAAIHEQILLCCRSYQQEYAGKIYLMCDKPRPSTFLFDERHLVTSTFKVDQQDVHGAGNRYIGSFLDLGLPIVNTIATIQRTMTDPSGSTPGTLSAVITTVEPTPAAAGDIIEVAGAVDPGFDDIYSVISATDSTIQCAPSYPRATGSTTGGALGYAIMRFLQRSPEINHRQAQLAAAQLPSPAIENTGRLSRNKTQLDFASTTYDQQNRLLRYEMIRALGQDAVPWKPPVTINLSAFSDSVDDLDRILKLQLCGDRITLTDRVTWEWAGEYEIMEIFYNFFNWSESTPGSGAADSKAGTIDLVLRSYEETRFVDVSDEPSASYATLPGESLWAGAGPSNAVYQVSFTSINLVDAGTSVTISVTGLEIRISGGPVLYYNDTTLTNLAYSTLFYLVVDDPFGKGGAIPVQATTIPGALSSGAGIMYIYSVQTPNSGGVSGPGSTGGSGGLPPPTGGGSGGSGGSGTGGTGTGGGGTQWHGL